LLLSLEDNMETTKICTCCNTEKKLTEFYKRSDSNSYRAHCKQCIKLKFDSKKEEIYIKRKKSYKERKDRLNKKRRKDRLENPQKYKEEEKKRSLNKERIEYKKEYSKKYRKTEKGKFVEKNKSHKRRTKYKKGDVSTEQLRKLIKKSKYCYWCNIKLDNNYHIDHYVPLSKGGEHTISNLVISCPSCNLRKNAKDPYEFALTKGRLL